MTQSQVRPYWTISFCFYQCQKPENSELHSPKPNGQLTWHSMGDAIPFRRTECASCPATPLCGEIRSLDVRYCQRTLVAFHLLHPWTITSITWLSCSDPLVSPLYVRCRLGMSLWNEKLSRLLVCMLVKVGIPLSWSVKLRSQFGFTRALSCLRFRDSTNLRNLDDGFELLVNLS